MAMSLRISREASAGGVSAVLRNGVGVWIAEEPKSANGRDYAAARVAWADSNVTSSHLQERLQPRPDVPYPTEDRSRRTPRSRPRTSRPNQVVGAEREQHGRRGARARYPFPQLRPMSDRPSCPAGGPRSADRMSARSPLRSQDAAYGAAIGVP